MKNWKKTGKINLTLVLFMNYMEKPQVKKIKFILSLQILLTGIKELLIIFTIHQIK